MPKPKGKTEEQKNTELEDMLSEAATKNLLAPAPTRADEGTSATLVEDRTAAQQQDPGATSRNEEQKGEKASPALPADPAATATVLPEPSALVEVPTPTHAPAPAKTSEPAVVASAAPTLVTATEDEPDSIVDAPESPGSTSFDISSLFEKSPTDKKTWVVRITENHREYLSLLGTSIGGGASIPDMVHNIIVQYIKAHDADLQKALQKKLRQRQVKR